MSPQWFLYSYLLATAAAFALLCFLGAQRWYWHVGSVMAGLAAGLTPPPSGNGSDLFYLVAGIACVFFLSWGLGALLFRRTRASQWAGRWWESRG